MYIKHHQFNYGNYLFVNCHISIEVKLMFVNQLLLKKERLLQRYLSFKELAKFDFLYRLIKKQSELNSAFKFYISGIINYK